MGSKGHLFISAVKSIIRMVSCVITIGYKDIVFLAIGFGLAEILGIAEELVDKR